jgi:phosphate transport system substrate-binding protein
MPRWKDLVITDRSKTALTTEDAMDTVHEVSGAIGFGPFTRTLEAKTVVIRVDGRYPTDIEYPSSVILALIYKNSTITRDARAFVAFLGADKARAIFEHFGGIPMKKNR